jgi:hypothetical protein
MIALSKTYSLSSKRAYYKCCELMQIASVAIKGKVKHLVGISLNPGSFVTNYISCSNVGLSKL